MSNKEKAAAKNKAAQKVQQSSAPAERLKTVVRRLPPNLPEEVFWQSVQPWVSEDSVTWKVFYPGKQRQRLNKENIPSRAYISFKDEEHLARFSREYDGHLFRDKAGVESQAVVEFAPYQKIPPLEKKKVDSRKATIETDEDYLSFLESLKASTTKPTDTDTLEALLAATQPLPEPKSTPLLDALKAEKSVAKEKEAILRNNAQHAKDKPAASSSNAPKKDDPKRKATAAPAPAQKQAEKEVPPPQGGKKGGKKAKGAPPAQVQPVVAGPSSAPSTPAKPAKPPREPRVRQPQQQQSQLNSPAPGVIPNAPVVPPIATPGQIQVLVRPTTPSTPAVPSSPAPGGRKGRPVIGLANRQFEAALSGAGVAKSRREREKERKDDAQAPKDPPSAKDSPGPSAGRGKKRNDDKPEAPTIMQPPRILARHPESLASSATPPSPGPAREGGGRGRGRGRGRGVVDL